MKTNIIFIGIAVFLYAFFHISSARAKTLPPVIISEIQIAGEETDDEFIELYNPGTASVSLKNYKVVRRTKTGISNSSIRSSFTDVDILPAKGYYLLVNKGAHEDIYSLKDNEFISSATLTADNSLAILDKDNAMTDAIAWGSEHVASLSTESPEANPGEKKSLARDLGTLKWSVLAAPTPMNSRGETYLPPVPIDATGLRINELLPNPKGDDSLGEFIELYNGNDKDINLEKFFLEDASGDQYRFSKGDAIGSKTLFVIARPTLTLTLVNSDETLSFFDPDGKLVSSAAYKKTKEGVSLNYVSGIWRGGTPTPGAENQLNTLPETREKVPKKGFKGTPVAFSARGKDADGDTLKYTWNFGDGHKSYKAKTSHTYEENGTYAVTLKTTDGSDDIIETFAIEIRSYKPPEVRITALLPNPEGSDTDNEWLLIENREKKEINLKNFGIATGWKNLANHPVREDFIIPPKKEARLTRMHSLFTLPNQKGKIELRAPDGKVLQKIRYKLEKSIAEDVVYQKKKGEKWSFASNAEKNTATETAPAATVSAEAAEESPEEGDAPDADTQPEDEPDSQETDGEVLGASITAEMQAYQYARNRQWMKLLNFGTRAALPDNIVFAPGHASAPAPEESLIPATPSPLLPTINASINTLINALR